jgi:GAF domain-containing protein
MKLLEQLRSIVDQNEERGDKAKCIVQLIRASGPYRWVGIYDVDLGQGTVSNISWDGPNAPAFPKFPTSKGLTSRAISQKRTVNVGNVANDASYLTALDSTRSEIIVPVFDGVDAVVVGTIDVESERLDAFDTSAQSLLEECARVLKTFWTRRV